MMLILHPALGLLESSSILCSCHRRLKTTEASTRTDPRERNASLNRRWTGPPDSQRCLKVEHIWKLWGLHHQTTILVAYFSAPLRVTVKNPKNFMEPLSTSYDYWDWLHRFWKIIQHFQQNCRTAVAFQAFSTTNHPKVDLKTWRD